jgi:hypothetical protein
VDAIVRIADYWRQHGDPKEAEGLNHEAMEYARKRPADNARHIEEMKKRLAERERAKEAAPKP